MKFSSKAQTLDLLRDKLQHSRILPQITLKHIDWREDSAKILNTVLEFSEPLLNEYLIIRSSAFSEDTSLASNAGKYTSIDNVPAKNPKKIKAAIEEVFTSYGNAGKEDEVFIQPFITGVKISGVIFTRDLNSFAPYYIINYDDKSGKTNTVTSGNEGDYKTRIIFRGHEASPQFLPLTLMCRELETIFESTLLDIEFLIDKNDVLYLLQIRPMVDRNHQIISEEIVSNYLRKIDKKISKWLSPTVKQLSSENVLAVMPDWNPAEIIGKHPRPLAQSLYKEVITDKVWAYQRYKYGYSDTRSIPLMVSLLGIPYIDVRASFNSFVPGTLSRKVAEKLVSYYIKTLRKHPELHDKVEFKIVFSCFHFNLEKELNQLLKNDFTQSEVEEIKDSLLLLTKNLFSEASPLWDDLGKIDILNEKFDELIASDLSAVDKIYWLIEDCKRFGTLPFAGVARAAFISVQILKSLVETKQITETEYHSFMTSLNTVSKELTVDFKSLKKDQFLKKYGHLRPGTYDICSPNYLEAYDRYFTSIHRAEEQDQYSAFLLNENSMEGISRLLKQYDFNISADQLFSFFRKTIEGREHLKLQFTRNTNEVLNQMALIGERFGFSRSEMSFVDIGTILRLYSELDHRDMKEILSEEISRGQNNFKLNESIKMPDIIFETNNIYEYELLENHPNFITMKRFMGETVRESEFDKFLALAKKIVFIASADPGYDWIFARNIGALITKYGGTNSHMAIRCAELGIPAVIGCGHQNFERWSKFSYADVDCENRSVKSI